MLYTSGRWRVHNGREHDFIAAWQDLGQWTAANIGGSTWAKLIQSRDDPRVFISFGPWRDDEAISQWRANPGFRERIGKIQELLESFEPAVFGLVAEIGPSTPDPH